MDRDREAPVPRRRRVVVVGIGSGDPDHLTLGAVRALGEADAIFLLDKGSDDPLAAARARLLDRVLGSDARPRVVHRTLPAVRGRSNPDGAAYEQAQRAWRRERCAAYRELLVAEVAPGETAAFLVWGDPSLFDGTVSVLRQVAEGEGLAVDVEVIPGVTSVAALAARHHVALHDVGEAVVITTGRRLRADGWPAGASSVVVMADAADTLDGLDDDLRIWWGARVGLPGERLISGRLGDCRDAIHAARADVRAAEGWLFDIYLLRR